MSAENMEAPEIYSGKVGVEIVPDMRKLRSFAKDFIALVDSYWPEESVNDMGEADGRSGSPQELRYSYTTGRNFSDASLRPSDVSAATGSYTVHPDS